MYALDAGDELALVDAGSGRDSSIDDMLAQQGLNLGQASVGQQSPGQQHATFAQHAGFGGSGLDTGTAEADPPPGWRSVRIATPGRVDDFA